MRQTLTVSIRNKINQLVPIAIGLLMVLAVAFAIVGVLPKVYKCSMCHDVIIGKPERIDERPVCDRCFLKTGKHCKTTYYGEDK